jgi:hypothetical protein
LCQARLGRPADARRSLLAARTVQAKKVDESARLLAHAEAAVLLAEGRLMQAGDLLAQCWADQAHGQRPPPWTEDLAYLLGKIVAAAGDDGEARLWHAEVHRRYAR